jgi:hypothetical protein
LDEAVSSAVAEHCSECEAKGEGQEMPQAFYDTIERLQWNCQRLRSTLEAAHANFQMEWATLQMNAIQGGDACYSRTVFADIYQKAAEKMGKNCTEQRLTILSK